MKENRINFVGLFFIIGSAIIMGVIGISIPKTINLINGLNYDSTYGYFASYIVCCLLFWLLTFRTSVTIKRESYIGKLQILCNSIDKSMRKKRTK